MQLHHARGVLDLTAPVVMGVLNVTPDSFSDGGRFVDPALAADHALQMRAAGAAIIDIGGESTRPGARPLTEEEELARVLPLLQRLGRESDLLLSVDTSSPHVAAACLDAGAAMINDIRALQRPGMLTTLATSPAAACLMHMQGEPQSMQGAPRYVDVVAEVRGFLAARIEVCEKAGIARSRLVVDPGFGFGKLAEHNLRLLAKLSQIGALGLPLLVGLSRKSMLKALTGREVEQRLAGSVALAALAVHAGARIVRAHDVAATLDAVKVAWAVRQAESKRGSLG